ncbi:MAG: hypothetical protein KatS3mg029_0860 [Saprospiraceae bacterium]|nr:MAG: hypothetical protein KatS3mg029_0857 [Saprospiraceae bacterium]GIV31509.1 MAG: hypothetical protein KatS3mg029_0860 [Saprospiraceae bacterium]
MKNFLTLVFMLTAVIACQAQDVVDMTVKTGKPQVFGKTITADGAVSLAEMKAKLGNYDSLRVKVRGKVSAVCQMKGCWMTLTDDGFPEEMMVRFEDYAFFVPKTIAGREVIAEGVVYKTITPVEELRHYAEDAGKSKEEIEAITEPKEELRFLASGVLLLPEKSKRKKG